MRILAVDIGTGTQDILLFDSSQKIENCVQMIMPSPTSMVAKRIYAASSSQKPLLLKGVNMGGGPNRKALERHISAGLTAYATEEAALTFDDDLERVKEIGVIIINPDKIPHENGLEIINLKDFDLDAITGSLKAFNVDCHFDALAVAVLDHGFAPGTSNRLFRFDYLQQIVESGGKLVDFCYLAAEIPDYLTRVKAVAKSAGDEIPLIVSDTGVAAVLGILQDEETIGHDNLLAVNAGNSHTIAFHLIGDRIAGLFEHHTGTLKNGGIDSLITGLWKGTLTGEEVYDAGGHGAFVTGKGENEPFMAVTGPRLDITQGSSLNLHKAVPHGDIMLTGCYGLVQACALKNDEWREEIEQALQN